MLQPSCFDIALVVFLDYVLNVVHKFDLIAVLKDFPAVVYNTVFAVLYNVLDVVLEVVLKNVLKVVLS